MQRRIIGALKEGFYNLTHTRGPDPTGIGLRTVQRAHQVGLNTRTALSHIQSIHSEYGTNPQALKQSLQSLFNLVAPNLSASARSILHSGPTSSATVLAHSQSNLARGVTRGARTTIRPGFGARPVFHAARPQVHHVGLGSARGFATGAGRPVFQNIQNAPQYIRAIADQKDRLKQGKTEQRRARKALKSEKGKGKSAARFSPQSTLFPVVKPVEFTSTAAIVLTVPLEPAAAVTAATEIDAEAIASTSSYHAQGHLFDASFLRILRARETQLARASNVYRLVQDAVDDGTATREMKTGPEEEHRLVVRFDERVWSMGDIRALFGLWDDLRDVWYRMSVDNAGWISEASHLEEAELSDVPTMSDISAHLASPTSSSASLSEKASVDSDHATVAHDHDLRAHDAVLETLQLPSIMFGASFVDHSPAASSSSSPSISRNPTFSSSFDALSAARSDSDDEQHLRDFIDQITALEGGFPSRERLNRLSADSTWNGGMRSASEDSLASWSS